MAAKKPAAKPKPATLTTITASVPLQNVTVTPNWRNPDWKPAPDDDGLEARMWRLAHG